MDLKLNVLIIGDPRGRKPALHLSPKLWFL